MSIINRLSFRLMALVHHDIYGLLRDPANALTLAGVKEGQTVLEVGCGPGFFTVEAARMVGENGSVIALDINPVAMEWIQWKIEQAGVSNIEPLLAEAGRTGLADASVDLAFVFGLELDGRAMEPIYRELHRVLKTGGTLAIEGKGRPPREQFRHVQGPPELLTFTISRYEKV
jgi:ubiquinone/menaquinone biosynthesis C-methylase UbiE